MIYILSLKKIFTVIIFFFIFSLNKVYASNQIFIIAKVDNEIITNIDIDQESRYLLALNPNLRTIKKDDLIKLAKRSIIKEKVKKIEIEKFFDSSKTNEYFEEVFKDFYNGLNINNEKNFEIYLSEYNLSIDNVKKKINIETLWNELIYSKFKNQIDIDQEKLKNKIKNELSNKEQQQSYLLYEIIFNANNKEDLKRKYEIIKNNINEIGFQKTANLFEIGRAHV